MFSRLLRFACWLPVFAVVGLLLGALTGAAVTWCWGEDPLQGYYSSWSLSQYGALIGMAAGGICAAISVSVTGRVVQYNAAPAQHTY